MLGDGVSSHPGESVTIGAGVVVVGVGVVWITGGNVTLHDVPLMAWMAACRMVLESASVKMMCRASKVPEK